MSKKQESDYLSATADVSSTIINYKIPPEENMEQTYNEAAKFILEHFNLSRLGCLYYKVDYDEATEAERGNASKKIKSRLRTAKPKFMNELTGIIGFNILTDQHRKEIKKQVKR